MPYRDTFHQVFSLEMAIALSVFGAVVLLMLWAMVRSRVKRRFPKPRSEWNLLEGSFVVAYLGMATFLVVLSLTANRHEQRAAGRPALTVAVTGYQWCWRFNYLRQHATVNATCVDGVDGRNLPTLVVPVDTSIELTITSSDVVHEFWVPALDYKVEAFPGHLNVMRFTLTKTGRWIGRCAEFCGLLHTDMHFYLQAVSKSAYRSWLASMHSGSSQPGAIT